MRRAKNKLIAGLLSAAIGAAAGISAWAGEPTAGKAQPIRYGQPRRLCSLANRRIDESSGLVHSRGNPGVFWTHNDSGDLPQLYAFDRTGKHLGTYAIPKGRNRDWEDLATHSEGDKQFLVICDTGDNFTGRSSVTLHFVEEPTVDPNRPTDKGKLHVVKTIDFTYEDRPQDCEAVAVDSRAMKVYLISKLDKRTVYELAIPAAPVTKGAVAKAVAPLPLGPMTAMDISPDGLRAVVLTYPSAYEYSRTPGEQWAAAFKRPGRELPTPHRQQGESICYGPDGKTLYLTSEKLPTPLLEVPLAAE